MSLKLVISGGQSGADIAGVLAGLVVGLETGGTMPNGWITLDGPKPQYAELFGMVEHTSPKYPPRTEDNVKNSDATLQIAKDFSSAGERLTSKLVKAYCRPNFLVDVSNPPSPKEVAEWIFDNSVKTLNVAGNSHKTFPAIGLFAFEYMLDVFSELGLQVQNEKRYWYIIQRFSEGIYQHD